MAVLVYSVVRRHMKRTSPGAFTSFDGSQSLPVDLSLVSEESVVGWYRNPPPWQQCLILFTSKALCFIDDEHVDRLEIEDIVGYENPDSKADVSGVRILTREGFRFARVAGSFGRDGNQKDAYSLIMVLRALVGDRLVVCFPDKSEVGAMGS